MQKFKTAVAAAASLGVAEGTYRAYERREDSSKHTPMDLQRARQFAKKFAVSWSWLLDGTGTPLSDTPPMSPVLVRIASAMAEVPEEKQEAMAAVIEAMLKTAAG